MLYSESVPTGKQANNDSSISIFLYYDIEFWLYSRLQNVTDFLYESVGTLIQDLKKG